MRAGTTSLWRAACAVLVCVSAVSAASADTHWIGNDGDWNLGGNWGAGVPKRVWIKHQ